MNSTQWRASQARKPLPLVRPLEFCVLYFRQNAYGIWGVYVVTHQTTELTRCYLTLMICVRLQNVVQILAANLCDIALYMHEERCCYLERDRFVFCFVFVFLFNGISTFVSYSMLKISFQYYLIHSWEDKRVHTFPKSIFPKVNVIARLEFEYAYSVQRFNHYTTRTPLLERDRAS